MGKDFKKWHVQKSDLNDNGIRPFFHEREIWSASLGVNLGFEQDGKGEKFLRPVLVLKKFNNEIFWCLPLTKSQKNRKYYFQFFLNDSISTAILSQIRLIDSKRLRYKVGIINKDDFSEIIEKLKQLLA